MRGNRHDRACTVTDQNVVSNPNRNRLERNGIDGERPRKHTRLFLVSVRAVPIALECRCPAILFDLGGLLGSCNGLNKWMLRSDDHIGGSIERVGPCRVNAEHVVGNCLWIRLTTSTLLPFGEFRRGQDWEVDFGSGASADPIGLKLLDSRRPIKPFQIADESVTVGCDTQHPLSERHTLNRMASTFALAVNHFFIGQNGPQARTPIDERFALISKPVFVSIERDRILSICNNICRNRKLFDGASALLLQIKPRIEQ